MDFVALDFETANYARGSVCEIGIAIVRSGKVVDTLSRLVKPRDNWFHPMNTQIHGIDAKKVEHAPEFDTVWQEVQCIFENSNVVAHNASFDISVLRHVLVQYDLPFPEFNYTCSLLVARCAWQGLSSYGLSALSQKFNIKLNHHSAESDALACAQILLKASEACDIGCFDDIAYQFGIRIGKVFPGGYLPSGKQSRKNQTKALVEDMQIDLSKIDKNHPLYGKYIVFTGAMQNMSRSEAQKALMEVGGYYTNGVNQQTDFLVLGEKAFKHLSHGIKSSKIKQAERYFTTGHQIEFLSEQQFLKLLQPGRNQDNLGNWLKNS